MPKPIIGEANITNITLKIKLCQSIAFSPKPAMPAPKSPPIKAWGELEGIPSFQVMRFHATAPTKAASIIITGIIFPGLLI